MQRCPILLLEAHLPAELSFNLFQHTCLEISSNNEDLDKLVQVCLIRVVTKLCCKVVLQEWDFTIPVLMEGALIMDAVLLHSAYFRLPGVKSL